METHGHGAETFEHTDRVVERIANHATDVLVKMLLGILTSLTRPLATVTEILLRGGLGERYFTLWNLLGGIGLIVATAFFPVDLAAVRVGSVDLPIFRPHGWWVYVLPGLWLLLFVIGSSDHYAAVGRRYAIGKRWHSYSIGTPWVADHYSAEPWILLFLAAIDYVLGYPGVAIMTVASMLVSLAQRHLIDRRFWHRTLDALDQQIEAEQLANAVRHRLESKHVEGLRAVLPAHASDAYRQRVAEALAAKSGRIQPASPESPVRPRRVRQDA